MSEKIDDLNIGDQVIYNKELATIMDYYGSGIYGIVLLFDEFMSVHRKYLIIESEVI